MDKVMFSPSEVTLAHLRHCTGLPTRQNQIMAAALTAYLAARDNQWSTIDWTELAAHLRALPEGSDVPGANEAKSVFSWELMSGMKELIRLGLITYHEDDNWKERIEISLALMKIYLQAYQFAQHAPQLAEAMV